MNWLKDYIVKLMLLLLTYSSVMAVAPFQSRYNYGARYEPNDMILHGAGQTYWDTNLNGAFERYAQCLGDNKFPVLFMDYCNVTASASFYTTLKTRLDTIASNYDKYVIPQIGVNWTADLAVTEAQALNFANNLKSINRPCFLRLGYEFNGPWQADSHGSTTAVYNSTNFKLSFQRITQSIRAAGVEAATVWCAYPGFSSYYGAWSFLSPYYPGDTYVDWWGIDVFSSSDLTAATTIDFLNRANIANKPVLIGEATPRYIGANDSSDWNSWFEPFFDMIYQNRGIKAHTYIDWDWSQSIWNNWGDARLESPYGNQSVRDPYLSVMGSPYFVHAQRYKPSWAGAVCGDWGYFNSDYNKDCKVDFLDLSIFFNHWLNYD